MNTVTVKISFKPLSYFSLKKKTKKQLLQIMSFLINQNFVVIIKSILCFLKNNSKKTHKSAEENCEWLSIPKQLQFAFLSIPPWLLNISLQLTVVALLVITMHVDLVAALTPFALLIIYPCTYPYTLAHRILNDQIMFY